MFLSFPPQPADFCFSVDGMGEWENWWKLDGNKWVDRLGLFLNVFELNSCKIIPEMQTLLEYSACARYYLNP